MTRSAGRWARVWGWMGCFGLWTAGVVHVAAQTAFAAPPEGLRLQVAETALDVTNPSALMLHVQLVNDSARTVTLMPGTGSLIAGGERPERRCDNPPNPTARPDVAARILQPGSTFSEALVLNTDVCRGLLPARSLQIERVVSIGDGVQASVRSQLIPVQNGHSAEQDIRAMLMQQAADWNRGDLDAFARGYKNSPDILFIGRKISRGYEQMLDTYKRGYPTREAMGTLTFSELEVQPLDTQFATVTGHFHLERTQGGGGNADGFFLLVVENTASGWKIVRDDSTVIPPPAAH